MGLQMRDNLIWLEPVDFRTLQNTTVTEQPVQSLLSHNIAVFSIFLSVIHGTDMIIPRNTIFSQIFSLKFFLVLCFSGFLSGDAVTPDSGFCFS